MKKKISFYFLIFFVLLAPAKIFISGISSEGYPNRGVVEEVIDGDTVRLANGEMVRYLGINAPEVRWKKGDSWVYRPQLLAEEAVQLNTQLVGGKEITLEYDAEKRDKFGRLLAYVYVGGLMVNAEILGQGYALLDLYVPNTKYADLLVKNYKEAKENNRGLWSMIKLASISPVEVRKYSGKVKVIESKIVRCEDKDEYIRLILEKEMAILVRKSNLPLFTKDKIDPSKDYIGKKIRFAGLIRRNVQVFEVLIHHPVEIEIIK